MRRFTIEYDWQSYTYGEIRRRVDGVMFSGHRVAWVHTPEAYGGGSGNGHLRIPEGDMSLEDRIIETTVYMATGIPVDTTFTWIDEEGA